MEVVLGTEADRKGGHIARRRADGQLVLRETAQTPARGRGVVPRLPPLALLQHQQPVGRSASARRDARANRRRARAAADRQPQDRRPARPELAAGAPARERDGGGDRQLRRALSCCCVPRTRFVPVKTTDDLLVLRSDVYTPDRRAGRRAALPERADGPALRRARQALLQAARRLRAALPGRAAVAARGRAARRATATSPSGRACSCAARSSSRRRRADEDRRRRHTRGIDRTLALLRAGARSSRTLRRG